MADLGTMSTAEEADAADGRGDDRGRRIRRARSLPGSRAVVGALLVTAAAVGVFAAYLGATAEPGTRYVVAQADVPVGTMLTDGTLRDTSLFGLVPLDLPPELAAASVPEGQALALEGQVTTAALAAGDLLSRSALSDGTEQDDAVQISFPIETVRAAAGDIAPGDRVDVAVTYGTGLEAYTLYVARNALVADVGAAAGGLEGEALALSLALPDDERVLAIAQAVNTGEVFVTRSSRASDDIEVAPYAPPGAVEGAPSPGASAGAPPSDEAADDAPTEEE